MHYTPALNAVLNEAKGSSHILHPEYALNQILHFVQNDKKLAFFCVQNKR